MPIAPERVQEIARQGLELRKKWGRGGTAIGVKRAIDLSNGADLSWDTIGRIAKFKRHIKNYRPDKKEADGGPTAGTIAVKLWGGIEGIEWAERILEEHNNKKSLLMQYKSFEGTLEFKEDSQDNYFTITGLASTFGNVDFVDDVVEKGAFKKSLKKRTPKFLWQHNMREAPIGKITNIKETDTGLEFTALMPKDDARVRDTFMPQIKVGSLDTFSIGYRVELAGFNDKTGIRTLKEIDLYEISLVTFPANDKAVLQSYKMVDPKLGFSFADRDTEWDGDKAIANIKEFTNSQEEPSADYYKYFMYFDEPNEDNFTAYKMPFVDIIDNKPRIIPKAIFSIAGALQGARGGLDIPEEDKQEIVNKINKIYSKMAKEFDDESLVSPLKKDFIDNIDSVRSLEKALSTKFSNQEAKMLVAKTKEIFQRDVEVKNQRDAEKQLEDQIAEECILIELNLLKQNLQCPNNNKHSKQ